MSTVINTSNSVAKPAESLQQSKSGTPIEKKEDAKEVASAYENQPISVQESVNAVEEESSAAGFARESEKPVGQQELEEVVSNLNDFVQNVQRDISFNVDENSGGVVVKVRNSDTEEVIRQIPNEEVLAIKERLKRDDEDPTGLVLNARV